jgi:hypothetical protein
MLLAGKIICRPDESRVESRYLPATPPLSRRRLHMNSEGRRSPRFAFYASAEITELQTQTRLTTRTSELSRYGCYMDMLNPLPLGTAVKIQLIHHEQTFDATGRIIYSQSNMGMGVAFDEIEAGYVLVLEKWLSDLSGSS